MIEFSVIQTSEKGKWVIVTNNDKAHVVEEKDLESTIAKIIKFKGKK